MRSLIALLGHTQKPTCGVEDYCGFLGQALGDLGVGVQVAQVEWARTNWVAALVKLWRESSDWRDRWVVLQYTAGAWSRYGSPVGALFVMTILRLRRVRFGVMFHEPYRWEAQPANLWDRIRAASQTAVIRILYRGASKAIFADPLETITWLPANHPKAVYIPIGANVPEPTSSSLSFGRADGGAKTVAVFCLSDPPARRRELGEIAHAIQAALPHVPGVRLVLLGKGTAEARGDVERSFAGIPVQVENLGIRGAEEVSKILAESDAMLCVRGRLFPRRGSALAGVACGVPVIAYSGPAEQTPLSKAGIEFVPYGDRDALGAALTRVLTDRGLQTELRARNRWGQQTYFSWRSIAARHLETLGITSASAAGVS